MYPKKFERNHRPGVEKDHHFLGQSVELCFKVNKIKSESIYCQQS